jgi:integrase
VREIRLATSKNGSGRVLPYAEGSALDNLIERRWEAREYETPEGPSGISAYVFHRQGRPVVDIRKAWAKGCAAAKVPGRLFHDLRRTGVRDVTRAGVPQSVSMAISGHRTVSVFLRYNIAREDDKREARVRTEAMRAAQAKAGNVLDFGREAGEAERICAGPNSNRHNSGTIRQKYEGRPPWPPFVSA